MVPLLVLCFVSLVAASAWAGPAYTIADLGPVRPVAVSVGRSGVAAGTLLSPEDSQAQAVIARPGQRPQRLGVLPEGTWSEAQGLAGPYVVGTSSTGFAGTTSHAFRWTAREGMQDLGTLGAPELVSSATGVNGAGVIAGVAQAANGTFDQRAVVWTLSGIQDLGTLGGAQAQAFVMNEAGDIGGTAQDGSLGWHATLWPVDGEPVSLDTLGGTHSVVLGLNMHQDAVGVVTLPGGLVRAFVADPVGGMRDMAPLPGDTLSYALAINDPGVWVGWSAHVEMDPETGEETLVSRAIVGTARGPAKDLNRLMGDRRWVLQKAYDVNASGQIVGMGLLNGQPRGFLLTPVPVPPPPKPRAKAKVQALVQKVTAKLAQEMAAIIQDFAPRPSYWQHLRAALTAAQIRWQRDRELGHWEK